MTKSLTAGLTFFLSNYCAQRIESTSSSPSEDRKITRNTTGQEPWCPVPWDCSTLVQRHAHACCEWIFTRHITRLLCRQKAALGQVIFGPSFTCVFFAISLRQSGSFTLWNWLTKIKNDLPFISGAGFWPLVDLDSYSLIPIKFIPLFINMCSSAEYLFERDCEQDICR